MKFQRRLCFLFLLLAAAPMFAQQQQTPVEPAPAAVAAPEQPLPDLATLMAAVQKHQERDEAIEKKYIYRSTLLFEFVDKDGKGKPFVREVSENYWADGQPVSRVIERDGKPLTPEQQAKEDERTRKYMAERKKKDAGKKAAKDEDISLSRLLELGTFTAPRREMVNGRPTIAVDFTGNPKAKTRNDNEKVIREVAGTVWVDEADRIVQHLEGRLLSDFKVGGGLVASVGKGTTFSYSQVRVNDEIWLRDRQDLRGHFRLLLLFAKNAHMHNEYSDFHRLQATTKVLPGFVPAEGEADALGVQEPAPSQDPR